MMKVNSKQIRSKSSHRKPPQDIYFPAGQLKNYKILSINKNPQEIRNQNLKEHKKPTQLSDEQYNPENSINLLSQRKKNYSRSSSLNNHKKLPNKSSPIKINEKSNEWLNKSAMYFTKRQAQIFQQSICEHEQKRKFLDSKLLQKKQSFESFKKMKQILRTQQKLDLLSDIQFKKLERQREKQIFQARKKLEKSFIHEENLAKIEMERYKKQEEKQNELILSRQKLLETENHSQFLKIEQFKAKKIHINLLQSRLNFLKNERKVPKQSTGYLTQRLFSKKSSRRTPKKFDLQ